jgi:hypothetical protein
MNAQVIRCPSCGANPLNHINCEYCGSLFVRYEEIGLSIDNILKPDGNFGGFVIDGLKEALEENLSLQQEESFVVTDLGLIETSDKEEKSFFKGLFGSTEKQPTNILQIIQSSGVKTFFAPNAPSFPGVAIHIPFINDGTGEYFNEPGTDDDCFSLSRFEQMEESKLFSIATEQTEYDMKDYVLDFGNDATGAAYLTSKILIEFYGFSTTSSFSVVTSDYC